MKGAGAGSRLWAAWRVLLVPVLTLALILGLFTLLYQRDNKYRYRQPQGSGGVLELTQADLERPIFLVNGWMMSCNGEPEEEAFIGQYSSFSFTPGGEAIFGEADYRLELRLEGAPRDLVLQLPETFTPHTLYVGEEPAVGSGGGTTVGFELDGRVELRGELYNDSCYYSGLYYPPVLGTAAQIARLQFFRNLFYGVVIISALTLMLFSLAIWLRGLRDTLLFHFALLCLALVVCCLHSVLWQLGWSGPGWYCVEDAARLLMWSQTLSAAAIAAGLWERKWMRRGIYPGLLTLAVICLYVVRVVIPVAPWVIPIYSLVLDGLILSCWLGMASITWAGLTDPGHQTASLFSLAGCCALGATLLFNLLGHRSFEPIYTGWPGEWAGFMMVLIFAALGNWRNAVMLKENDELTHHLEETVNRRTAELNAVIEERKCFFSDMAHNLKAPIASIHGFISLIRSGSVGVDDELLGYISLIESENLEMRRRVQALNELNAFDRMAAPREPVELNRLLAQVDDQNRPEAEAMGIHLTVGRLPRPVTILAQREKLLTLFENLILNAISFTPMDGAVDILPELLHQKVQITVRDTGRGIPPEQLGHVFDRFFVGRDDKTEGSGLGLYIVRLTVEELGGTITVQSEPGRGAAFCITLPL